MTEDRWEAFGDYDADRKFNEGVMADRERIIKLLEDYAFNNGPSGGILFAVAFIKGEN